MLLRLLCLLLAATVTDAALFPISTSSYPHLFVKAPVRVPVIWHSKAFASELAQSIAVRIGPRGIRFIPQSHTLTLQDWAAAASPCLSSRESLCTLRNGQQAFPNYPSPAYVTQRSPQQQQQQPALSCPETFTGRSLLFESTESRDDDLSLCNVMGAGTEFVYVPSHDTLYSSTNPIPILPMILASVLAILLMMIIGYNLQSILGDSLPSNQQQATKKERGTPPTLWNSTSHQLTLACMIALVATAWASNSAADSSPLSCFVTREDRIAFVLSTVYVGYYVARIVWDLTVEPWIMHRGDDEDLSREAPKPVNAVLACLSIAVQRIYASVDNPYTVVLAFLMLTWTFHKISMHDREHGSTARSLLRSLYWADVLFDCATISVMLYHGDIVQPDSDPSITATLVLQAILAAAVFNRALVAIHYAPEAAEMAYRSLPEKTF